jgi:hypothetical protein
MNKYASRLTSSARGESFNVLAWMFLIPTFFCGLALAVGVPLGMGGAAEIMSAALSVPPFDYSEIIWGVIAMLNIVIGATFLLFNFPPFGRASGIVGFMLWIWAAIWFFNSGLYLLVGILCLPQACFWIWQYFTLSRFRREDATDKQTMVNYDEGLYDDELNPKEGCKDREHNRGRDLQSNQTYDNPDDGGDKSRPETGLTNTSD